MAAAAVREETCGVPCPRRRRSRPSCRLTIPPRSSARWDRHSCPVKRPTQSTTWRPSCSVPPPWREPWLPPPGSAPSWMTTDASGVDQQLEDEGDQHLRRPLVGRVGVRKALCHVALLHDGAVDEVGAEQCNSNHP